MLVSVLYSKSKPFDRLTMMRFLSEKNFSVKIWQPGNCKTRSIRGFSRNAWWKLSK